MSLWTPAEITTELWFDASDNSSITLNGSTVSQWNDKSGNDRHVVQNTGNNQPLVISSGLDGKNVLQFDGANDFLRHTPSTPFALNSVSIFAIFKVNGSTTYIRPPLLLDYSNTGRPVDRYNSTIHLDGGFPSSSFNLSTSLSSFFIYELTAINNAGGIGVHQVIERSNGVQVSSKFGAATWSTANQTINIGMRYDNATSLNGQVAEIIVVADTVSTIIRKKIEGYLAHKWGLSSELSSEHLYKSAPPVIQEAPPLWNPAEITTDLWLDASDSESITLNGSNVSQWNDKSGNNRHALQESTSLQPIRTADGIQGDGTGRSLVGTINDIADGTKNEYRIYIVAQSAENRGATPAESATGIGYYSDDSSNNTALVITGNTSTTTGPVAPIFSISGNGVQATETRNGLAPYLISRSHSVGVNNKSCFIFNRVPSLISVSIGFNGYVSSQDPAIDNLSWTGFNVPGEYTTGSKFNGIVHEVIILLRIPSQSEDDKIVGYLAHKWGLIASLSVNHPYRYSAPKILSNEGKSLWEPSRLSSKLIQQIDPNNSSTITIATGVSAINNVLGGSLNYTQGTGSYQPVLVPDILGSKSVLRFNAGRLMSCPRVLSDDLFSIFVLLRAPGQDNKAVLAQHAGTADTGRTSFITTSESSPYKKGRLFFNNGTSYSAVSTTDAFDDTWNLVYSESDGNGRSLIRVNAGDAEGIITGQTWTPLNTAMRLGGLGSAPEFDGDIAYILICSKLTDDERSKVEGWLMWKFGLEDRLPSDHIYKSAPPYSFDTSIIPSSKKLKLKLDHNNISLNQYNFPLKITLDGNNTLHRPIFDDLYIGQKEYPSLPEPIAHWTMDNYSGSVLYDEKLTYNGNITNYIVGIEGKFGNCLKGGDVDSVIRNVDFGVSGVNFKTISFWLKRNNTSKYTTVISNPDNSKVVAIQTAGSGNYFYFFNDAQNNTNLVIADNTNWHHVVITEGSNSNNHWVYINGVKSSSEKLSNLNGVFRYLGRPNTVAGQEVPDFDNFQVFDVVLSDSDVLKLYNTDKIKNKRISIQKDSEQLPVEVEHFDNKIEKTFADVTASNTVNWAGLTIRLVIAPSYFTKSGNKIKIGFLRSTQDTGIAHCFIGEQASSGNVYDFQDGTQVRVTFDGGNNGKTITVDGQGSDWIDFNFDKTKTYIISIECTGYVGYLLNAIGSYWKTATGEAGKSDVSGYTVDSQSFGPVKNISVMTASAVLHTKIPVYSASTDTELTLCWDSNQEDNTQFVGEAGDSGSIAAATAFSRTMTAGAGAGWEQTTYRYIILGSEIVRSGNQIRIGLNSSSGGPHVWSDVFIGEQDPYGSVIDILPGSIKRVTWNGDNEVSISGTTTVYSDWVDFEIDETKTYIVSTYISSDVQYMGYANVASAKMYHKAGVNEADWNAVSIGNYTTLTYWLALTSIETRTATPSARVWDGGFAAVYHMAQDPTGGADCIKDSTFNLNHGTPVGSWTQSKLVDTAYGKGLVIDGDAAGNYINCGNDSSLNLNSSLTMEAVVIPNRVWVYSNQKYLTMVSKKNSDWTQGYCLDLYESYDGYVGLEGYAYNAGLVTKRYAGTVNRVGTFNYFAVTAKVSEAPNAYDNGVYLTPYATTVFSSVQDSGLDLLIGEDHWTNANGWGLGGTYLEVRISRAKRSADWIKLTYLSLMDQLVSWSEYQQIEYKLYQNGIPLSSMCVDSTLMLPESLSFIGKGSSQSTPKMSIREVRVSNIARSEDWVKATNLSVKNNLFHVKK